MYTKTAREGKKVMLRVGPVEEGLRLDQRSHYGMGVGKIKLMQKKEERTADPNRPGKISLAFGMETNKSKCWNYVCCSCSDLPGESSRECEYIYIYIYMPLLSINHSQICIWIYLSSQ